MRAGECCARFKLLRRRAAETNIRYIHNRVPIAAQLANLLGINFEKQVGAMKHAVRFRANVRNFNSSPGNGSKDAH